MKLRLENEYISMSDYCRPCNNCVNQLQGYISMSCDSNIMYVETDEHLFCKFLPHLLISSEPLNTTVPNCIINKLMRNFIKNSENEKDIHAKLYFHQNYGNDLPITFVMIACITLIFHTFIKYIRMIYISRRLRIEEYREANYAPIVEAHKGSDICTICIEEFKEDEKVRKLKCGHEFHIECIDEWKKRGNRTCPNCNENFIQNNTV